MWSAMRGRRTRQGRCERRSGGRRRCGWCKVGGRELVSLDEMGGHDMDCEKEQNMVVMFE